MAANTAPTVVATNAPVAKPAAAGSAAEEGLFWDVSGSLSKKISVSRRE
jgi:hypothetical protein